MESQVKVEAYSLIEFCQKVEPLIRKGYGFDIESNENCPQTFGSYMAATLVDQTEKKRPGRPPTKSKEVESASEESAEDAAE